MSRKRIYTEEELKERHRESVKKHREMHPEMTRASSLIQNYKKEDRKYGRELPDFDSKWMVENILLKPCHYCGETGWDIIGCDRIDNSKGHIKSNVVPCCLHCNMVKPKEDEWKEKYGERKKKPIMMFDKDNKYIKDFLSAKDASIELGIYDSDIRQVLSGTRKHTRGYIFKYKN